MADGMYTQYKKNIVRHNAIQYAVSLLTAKRFAAPCVSRDYVRNVYDYFVQTEDENRNKTETLKIKPEYITAWEILHDSFCQSKRPSDLNICYLCGPEPNNDFDEFVSLGVLPQNIWAFEDNRGTYEKAVSVYSCEGYRQPRIVKQNIERFFEQTPKKFDVIYIDACGSIPSEQHALRCISSVFKHHRLNSPGVVISNFAEPDDKSPYIELIGQYLLSKKATKYEFDPNEASIIGDAYGKIIEYVSDSFSDAYSDFISYVLRDIPSVIVPIQRFWNNPYKKQIFGDCDRSITDEIEIIRTAKESTARFFITHDYLKKHNFKDSKIDLFIREVADNSTLIDALSYYQLVRSGLSKYSKDAQAIHEQFEQSGAIHQFLDKPHSNLLFDVLINQLAYPFHCNTRQAKRFKYTAKSTTMYTDIMVYDECRYIYEWLPPLHQIASALEDPSCQYVFRFALDGLVKSRQLYNNEFFYQGSVVPDSISGFCPHTMPTREKI